MLTNVLDELDDAVASVIIVLNRVHYGIRDAERVVVDTSYSPPSDRWYRLYEQLTDRVMDGTRPYPESHIYTLGGGLILHEAANLERRVASLPRSFDRTNSDQEVKQAAAAARQVAGGLLRRAQSLLQKSTPTTPPGLQNSDSASSRVIPSEKIPPSKVLATAVRSTENAARADTPFGDVGTGLPAAARAEAELDELALRASSGDQRALNELLDRIRGPVIWQCRARMGGRSVGQHTPEDIAQEVLIAVCGALGRFRPAETRWMAFVYGLVRNKVIDAYRAAGRDRSEPTDEIPDHVDEDERASPEAALLRSVDRDLLHELLSELPDQHREVLVLRVALGYSAEETARAVGLSPGAVRVTQHRAMLQLRVEALKTLAETPLEPWQSDEAMTTTDLPVRHGRLRAWKRAKEWREDVN